MKKPKVYNITPAKGQALLNFQGRLMPTSDLKMVLYETEAVEEVKGKRKLATEDKQKELNSDFKNLLLHGDCLSACAYLKSQNIKVDLVYIDPPFASGANYAKKIYLRNGGEEKVECEDVTVGEEIMYGDIWQKEDYLNWIYERLLAIREIMAQDASIYVHLDWHIGPYVKVLLDEVFGEENFRREVIWNRMNPSGGKAAAENWIHVHDNIYYYTIGEENTFNKQFLPYTQQYIEERFVHEDENGKYRLQGNDNRKQYLKDSKGKAVTSVWDLSDINVMALEKEDYTTQKPEKLIQRIIESSSDEGMVVADFFSGSGTTAKVANDLNRKFIACDIGLNAIQSTRDRLKKSGAEFDIIKVKDGLRLFRNPVQTTARLFSLIDGFKSSEELELGNFWDGGIAGAKGSFIPVKFIGIDKVLTKPLLDSILEEVCRLEETSEAGGVKLIYAYKDVDIDQSYVNKEIGKKSEVRVELISLDELLNEKRDMIFTPDNALIEVKKDKGVSKIKIKKYFSPYLKAKIDEFTKNDLKETKKEIDKEVGPKIKAIEKQLTEEELTKRWEFTIWPIVKKKISEQGFEKVIGDDRMLENFSKGLCISAGELKEKIRINAGVV